MVVEEKQLSDYSEPVRQLFHKWRDYMYSAVRYNMPDSAVHGMPHYERVLLYALLIAGQELPDDAEAMEILAHAAVWHDSRRMDDYLDTGHGARAAVYYHDYCGKHPEIHFHPESELLMRFHDIDDSKGFDRIAKQFADRKDYVSTLFRIFKDADALDRWRLGDTGLDPAFLRTETAKGMVSFSKGLVESTMDKKILDEISREVKKTQKENKWKKC